MVKILSVNDGSRILRHTGTINTGGSGSATGDKLLLSKIAGEDLTSFKAVCLSNDQAFAYNPTNLAAYNRLVGFAFNGALTGSVVQILTSGVLEVSFPVIDGAVYYVNGSSQLTTIPNAIGISQEVGIGISSGAIFIDIKQPIVLI